MVEEADILAELEHAQAGIEALDFEDATETDDQPVDETLAKLCVDAFQVSIPTFMQHWHTFEDMQAYMNSFGETHGFKIKHKQKDAEWLPPHQQPIAPQQLSGHPQPSSAKHPSVNSYSWTLL